MPRYAILLYRNENAQPAHGTPESVELYKSWGAFKSEIAKTNIMPFSNGLQPTSTATTVRVKDGKTITTDGPFAETKEQLAGIFIFECKHLDEAIHWAAKIPDAIHGGCVEIRPFWEGQG